MRRARIWLMLHALFLCGAVAAHDSRPLYLEVFEQGQGQYELRWHTPATVEESNLPQLIPPSACQPLGDKTQYLWSEAFVQSVQLACGEEVGGEGFGIVYPRGNPSLSTLVRYHPAEGEVITQLLPPNQVQWVPPSAQSTLAIAVSYTRLGISHIMAGLDHLLFLACLIWIAGTPKRVLLTVTGFTLAHSLTLVMAALGVLRVPGPPLEASIALSIVFLATELVKGRSDNLTWRHPIAVSSTFGLLHGFGFATVLQDVGLPREDLAVGLLFFNVGVELGQLLAIGLVLFTVSSVRVLYQGSTWRFGSALSRQQLAGYAVGGGATLWLIERIAAFTA
ncbi:hypothetical protein PS874_01513 [Pseudomonas fluorescens]|nr:hypothetical protein PS874_01513 [Pseudomonas fluorescens]